MRVRVKRLVPQPVEAQKCAARLSSEVVRFWRGRGRPGNQDGTDTCGCRASYRIDGLPFCAKHGALEALRLLTLAGGIEIP